MKFVIPKMTYGNLQEVEIIETLRTIKSMLQKFVCA